MQNTEEQLRRVEHCLTKQRCISNLELPHAISYVAKYGREWRGVSMRFGNWRAICPRMHRKFRKGALNRVFDELQRAQIVRVKPEAVLLDGTIVKPHPGETRPLRETAPDPLASNEADGQPRFIWLPRILERS